MIADNIDIPILGMIRKYLAGREGTPSNEELSSFIESILGSFKSIHISKDLKYVLNDTIADAVFSIIVTENTSGGKDLNISRMLSNVSYAIVPKNNDGYIWSAPKKVPKDSIMDIYWSLDKGTPIECVHIYDKNGIPTMETIGYGVRGKSICPIFKDITYKCDNNTFNALIGGIISAYGSNVKEVYIFDEGSHCEVVARKNPDGELTLVVY